LVHERRVVGIVDAIRLILLVMLGEVHDGKGNVRMTDRTVQAVNRLYNWCTQREERSITKTDWALPERNVCNAFLAVSILER